MTAALEHSLYGEVSQQFQYIPLKYFIVFGQIKSLQSEDQLITDSLSSALNPSLVPYISQRINFESTSLYVIVGQYLRGPRYAEMMVSLSFTVKFPKVCLLTELVSMFCLITQKFAYRRKLPTTAVRSGGLLTPFQRRLYDEDASKSYAGIRTQAFRFKRCYSATFRIKQYYLECRRYKAEVHATCDFDTLTV